MITLIANNSQLGGGILTVGQRITELRELKGYTINRLADKAAMSQTHLRDIEKDIKKPTVPTLEKICEELEISLYDFFSYTDNKDFLKKDPFLQKYYKLTPEQKKAFSMLIDTIIHD